MIHEVNGWEEDDDPWDDEEISCDHCDGSGRIPSPDYLAIQGFSYVACEHCENGLRWPAKF